jgi:integrase/recombinase XerD
LRGQLSAQTLTPGSPFIFCKENGDIFAQAASDFCHFRRKLEARAKKENLEFSRFRFHDLRHLYAVNALREGIDIYTLSQHLGHTSMKTTEIYLAFLTPAEALRAKHGGSRVGAEVGTKIGTATAVLPEDETDNVA